MVDLSISGQISQTVLPATPHSLLWKGDDGPRALSPDHTLYGNQDDFLQVLTVSSPAMSLSYVHSDRANLDEISSYSVNSKSTTTAPLLVPVASSTASASTPSTIEDETRLLYACPDCPKILRTPGLLRNHYNRTHNLRYTCNLCNGISFGLAADLKRHKKHVHQQGIDGDEIYRCTIPGCSTPTKIFRRKDNFNRHIKRCRKRIGKGKGKERAEPEVKEEQGPWEAHVKSRNMGI
ncbi:uncharacterized protein J4E88_003914 [Alternaria novae-zelandiae]|uniref:uncharacterized protein n=1 Tax=Alternaria novae-zelandiae TaxID=430562 RepID=UPI0020C4C5BB|nr:uncharacterized protein J4E88_003914 [Alternaria novae-zelandiae]KAI4686077.1 hypothetical protein J4E88_003914 [Alternaria novae-zelandiae]